MPKVDLMISLMFWKITQPIEAEEKMAGIFKKFFREGFIHGKLLLSDINYRNYCWLLSQYDHLPRFQEITTSTSGLKWKVPDFPSFAHAFKEIFVDRIYEFPDSGKPLKIVDLGANVGVATIFFRRRYPNAEISVYEADPYIFKYLENNLNINRIAGVKLYNLAVWDCSGTLSFSSDHADGGNVVSEENHHDGKSITVHAVDIREIVTSEDCIDFLKMDIEGAENKLIPLLAGNLSTVKNIFVEYHSRRGEKQKIDLIAATLLNEGFRLYWQTELIPARPYFPDKMGEFDLQINIFGRRDDQ